MSNRKEYKFTGNYNYENACKLAEEKNGKVSKTWDNCGQTIWIVTWYEKKE